MFRLFNLLSTSHNSIRGIPVYRKYHLFFSYLVFFNLFIYFLFVLFYFIYLFIFFATLCDKVCQWFATDRWFSPVSYTNKTDRHDIAEILLKVAVKHFKSNHDFSLLGPVPPKCESAIYYECVISWLYNLKTLSVCDEGYSRNALNWISTFLLCMDNPPLWWNGNVCLLYGEYQTHIRRKRQLVAAIDEHSARFRWREALDYIARSLPRLDDDGWLFCFSSSCVSYVASFSGLSIYDCPFGIL